jgi:ATP-dependent Lhr-like helicase
MEEAGKVRRGYFVESLSAAQFASASAIDRLRSREEKEEKCWVLAANDPANPYGSLFPWPENGGRPRRAVGCRVILVGGRPVFFLDKGARRLLSFPAAQEESLRQEAIVALADLADGVKGKCLRLQEIDGHPANQSAWAAEFLARGFVAEFHELTKMGRVG